MRNILIGNFPKLFPREVRMLKGTKDLVVAGLTRMHLWPSWITPNRLSMARIASAIPVFTLILLGLHVIALIVFTAGCVCDLFDGPLARLRDGLSKSGKRMGGVSALGSFLDPLADKNMVIGVCMIAFWSLVWNNAYSTAYELSDDATTQLLYQWTHAILLGTTILLELWSATKRTIDYLDFCAGRCNIDRLQATNEGKYKATLQFFATGGYVLATEWSLLVGLLLLTGSLTLAVKSLWSKYHHPHTT